MASKLPSQAFSSESLLGGNRVLQEQQIKMEPDEDTQAMVAELQDLWGSTDLTLLKPATLSPTTWLSNWLNPGIGIEEVSPLDFDLDY